MARKRAVLRLLASAVTHSAWLWCALPSCLSPALTTLTWVLHCPARSALLYVAGLVGVLAAPLLARNTFTDENALLVGSCLLGTPALPSCC
jgi:hypothetical protein